MEYIDKDALVAEIERRKKKNLLNESAFEEDIDILSFIDTLEVKEINIENEVDKYCSSEEYNNAIGSGKLAILLAKHFFELGMAVSNKAQEGE